MATVYRRGKTFWVRFRANGHHVRRSARTTKKTEAVAFLQRLLAEYAAKARGDRPRHPYEEAAGRFLREASIRPKTRLLLVLRARVPPHLRRAIPRRDRPAAARGVRLDAQANRGERHDDPA